MRNFSSFIMVFLGIALSALIIYDLTLYERYEINVSSPIEYALYSLDDEYAIIELNKAINFLEINHMTFGNTSLFGRKDYNDAGKFYNTLVMCRNTLKDNQNCSEFERYVVLRDVKQTLHKTCPPIKMYRHPFRKPIAILYCLFIGGILVCIAYNKIVEKC